MVEKIALAIMILIGVILVCLAYLKIIVWLLDRDMKRMTDEEMAGEDAENRRPAPNSCGCYLRKSWYESLGDRPFYPDEVSRTPMIERGLCEKHGEAMVETTNTYLMGTLKHCRKCHERMF